MSLFGAQRVLLRPESAEQVAPGHPEIAVVDLGVFVLTLVMPAMGFSHPDQQSQRPDPVSQIGVLEGQMHDQEVEPCADGQPQLGTPLLAQRGVERPPAL